jgi:hypothetical protein
MKKISIICLVFIGFFNTLSAQYELHFDTHNCTSFAHPVAKVIVIDQRRETDSLIGFVRAGKLNSKQDLIAKPSLAHLIEDYYTRLSAQSGIQTSKQIVVLLHQFVAKEDNTGLSEETARFFYTADYFISEDGGANYQLLGMVDEVIFVSSLEVTQLFLRTIDKSLCTFYEGLYSNPKPKQNRLYSYTEVQNFKEEQKKNFKAYSSDSFQNAYYVSWESFLDLNTSKNKNEELILKRDKLKLAKTYIDGAVEYNNLSADVKVVAFDNKLYFRYDNESHCLYKKNNDFFIVGYLPFAYWGNNGIIEKNIRYQQSFKKTFPKVDGGLTVKPGYYEFKIEARTGDLIPIRRLKMKKIKVFAPL